MKDNIQTHHKDAQLALKQGDFQQAHHHLIAILQQDKYFSDAYFLMAMITSAHHRIDKTIQLIEQALKLEPNNSEYQAHLAKHFAIKSDHVQAAKYAGLAATSASLSALTLDTIGVAYSKIGLHRKAINYFNQAVLLKPENSDFHYNLAISQTFVGNFDGARHSHEQVIKLDPEFCKSYAALSSLGVISKENNSIERLTVLYQKITDADDKLSIGHALAREYEAFKNYESAFKYLNLAKQSKLLAINYDFTEDQQMFKSLQHTFSEPNISVRGGFDTTEALFVVGMPRSGTTLVERIISQHTDVTSAGELGYFGSLLKTMGESKSPRLLDQETIEASSLVDFSELGKAYIESTRALTGETKRFVDKMPLNVLYVGFILKALPLAKIVCLDRNPLDTIVSNYRQLFSANSASYDYAYDLKTTAHYYIEFQKLTKIWLKLFPDNFYLVNYEALVDEPEVEARKLVEFCGLDWQEACLNIDKNTSPVATASAVQVRQPINNKSVGNWKKYDAYLDEVKQILNLS
jgi:tetratricopeptide (TPR) repeat protein